MRQKGHNTLSTLSCYKSAVALLFICIDCRMTAFAVDSTQSYHAHMWSQQRFPGVPWYRECCCTNGASGLSNGIFCAVTRLGGARGVRWQCPHFLCPGNICSKHTRKQQHYPLMTYFSSRNLKIWLWPGRSCDETRKIYKYHGAFDVVRVTKIRARNCHPERHVSKTVTVSPPDPQAEARSCAPFAVPAPPSGELGGSSGCWNKRGAKKQLCGSKSDKWRTYTKNGMNIVKVNEAYDHVVYDKGTTFQVCCRRVNIIPINFNFTYTEQAMSTFGTNFVHVIIFCNFQNVLRISVMYVISRVRIFV